MPNGDPVPVPAPEPQPAPEGPCDHDILIARGVVAFLGSTGLVVAVGSIVAACLSVEVPPQTMSLGVAAIGALSALLSKVGR